MSIRPNGGSVRRITFLTPGTFLKPIQVISTTINESGGQTATTAIDALNYFHATEKLREADWTVVKKHKTEKAALAFHEKLERETPDPCAPSVPEDEVKDQ